MASHPRVCVFGVGYNVAKGTTASQHIAVLLTSQLTCVLPLFAQVEDARAGYFQTSKGRRAALAVAAGKCELVFCLHDNPPVSKVSGPE